MAGFFLYLFLENKIHYSMDVKIFFDPVNERIYNPIESSHSFFKNIYLPGPGFPDIKKADIALIGLEEYRGGRS